MVGEGLKVFDKFKSNWISNLKYTGAVNNKQYWNKVEDLLGSIVDKCPTHKSFINKICYD
jgi:acyl-ACP thioesterase